MSYLQTAFDAVCREAKPAEGFFVCLMEHSRFFGGPEEGGWWGDDYEVVAYQHFATREQADAAKEEVEKLAAKLEADSLRSDGELCLRQMDWLEDRGLEADWLPENDGPSEFYVLVSEGLPENSRGDRQYC